MTLTRRINKLLRLEAHFLQKLRQTQTARLVLASLFFVFAFASAIRQSPGPELPALLLISLVFIYFVFRSRSLKRHLHRLSSLASFYQRQEQRQKGEPVARDWQSALSSLGESADKTLIADLNLLGPHSLFTSIDESISDGGRSLLARWMTAPIFNREEVLQQQDLVQKLRRERWAYIRLSVLASEFESPSTQASLEALQSNFLAPENEKKALLAFGAWLLSLGGIFWSSFAGPLSPLYFVIFFALTNFYFLNRIGPVFLKGLGIANHLSALSFLFRDLERRPDSSAMRTFMFQTFKSRPSKQLKGFQRILDFLSIEAHPIIYFVLNAVTPWTLFFSWLLEKERKKMNRDFPRCLEELNRLEALMSLSLMTIYQSSIFPLIEKDATLQLQGVYHPLIPRDRVVANDFHFGPGKTLGLLTGSNMSGKSTFLRTVGINQTLANMGAPVFAKKMVTTVFQLGSCIQVSDSLRDGFSYFYSEVLRLKKLIDQVHTGRPVLFLIDEIFRGTNNIERQIGSRAVIRSLLHPRSLGFVSTHDLELTHLEEKLSAIVNLHFRETIKDGEMFFSYHLQEGPCPTTNALVIMEKAGLKVQET